MKERKGRGEDENKAYMRTVEGFNIALSMTGEIGLKLGRREERR